MNNYSEYNENGNNEVYHKTNFIDGENIYILGDFDDSIAENIVPGFVRLIDELEAASSSKRNKITFYINSCGGYADSLFELLSLICIAKNKGLKIETIIIGRAYSCASLLAAHR